MFDKDVRIFGGWLFLVVATIVVTVDGAVTVALPSSRVTAAAPVLHSEPAPRKARLPLRLKPVPEKPVAKLVRNELARSINRLKASTKKILDGRSGQVTKAPSSNTAAALRNMTVAASHKNATQSTHRSASVPGKNRSSATHMKSINVSSSAALAFHARQAKFLHDLRQEPPAELSRQMRQIVRFFEATIDRLVELNRYDGQADKMAWCKEMEADYQNASSPFADFLEHSDEQLAEEEMPELARKYLLNNLFALGMAHQELEYLCGEGFGGRSKTGGRLDALRMVLTTYETNSQCQPGDVPCPGGRLSGQRPACECTCPDGTPRPADEPCAAPASASLLVRAVQAPLSK